MSMIHLTNILIIAIAMLGVTTSQITIDPMDVVQQLWKIYNQLFNNSESTKLAEKLLIRFNDKHKQLTWGASIDPKEQVKGPLTIIHENCHSLLSRSEYKMESCTLYYYADGIEFEVSDDSDLLEAIKSGPDYGNYRLLDLKCFSSVDPTNVIVSTETPNYIAARKAYDYVVGTEQAQSNDPNQVYQNSKDALNSLGMKGFEVNSEGLALVDQDPASFVNEVMEIGTAYGFDKKTMVLLKSAPKAGRQFQSSNYVKLDASSQNIVGKSFRYAVWGNDKGTYSVYIATAEFTYVLPDKMVDGSFKDKFLWGDGSSMYVKGEFTEQIKKMLDSMALIQFPKDIVEPKAIDFPDTNYGNHKEL